MEPTDQEIYRLLYRLGITANYAGFFHLAHALRLCAEKPDRLLLVTKLVYPEVAKAYRTNWKAVERNIRTVTTAAWAQGQPEWEALAGRPLSRKPCTAQLLALLTFALLSPHNIPLTQKTVPAQ